MTRFVLSLVLVGQLHTQLYGLKDVRKDEVRVGTLGAVKPPANAKTKNREATVTFEGGRAEQVMLYGGVVWTNPNKSPIERRLRGAVVPPAGTRVIVVGQGTVELLPADAVHLRKLELLFDDAARAKWIAGPESVLRADLDDPDLGELARAELSKRGLLTIGDLLMGDERLLHRHYDKLSPAERRKFLDAALPLAQAKPEARDRLFALGRAEPSPETIGALAPVFALYAPSEERWMSDARVALLNSIYRGPADLSPFADFLVVLNTHRPDHYRDDSDLPKLTAMLDAPAKQKVAIGFLTNAFTSTQLFEGIDLFLVEHAVRLAGEAPSVALLAPIEKWNLSKLRPGGRVYAVAGQLGIAAAVGTLDLPRARALAEPLLAGKETIAPEVVARYRAVVPPVVAAPAAFTLKSIGLGTRSLQPGVEVRFDSDRKGNAFLTLNFGKGDEVKTFPLDGEWPTEWKTGGWTFALSRVKSGGRYLNLSATPP